MRDPQIPANDSCKHNQIHEYWHEHDFCNFDDCAVNECLSCGYYAAECGDTYSGTDN